MPNPHLQNVVLSLALILMIGWLLLIGKGILLPVFTAVISVYVLNSATAGLRRWPVFRRLPAWVLRLLVLMVFTAALFGMMLVVSVTVDQLLAVAPSYQQNLETLMARVTQTVGFQAHPTWEDIRQATVERISISGLLGLLLSSLTSVGGSVFLVVVYAGFLFSERGALALKLAAAFPQDRAERTIHVVADINHRIGEYLAIKTLINGILGVLSFAILWWMDVDFALFWAMMIALLNYIPYVGSLIGVAFPVLLSLAQFGSIATTVILAVQLTAVQMFVGNVLEPEMIGRQLKLSPFVVLVALSVWATLWGIPGAILAIPMTSMIAIICAAFPETRFIAVLLAEKIGDEDLHEARPPT